MVATIAIATGSNPAVRFLEGFIACKDYAGLLPLVLPKTYICARATEPAQIDGNLDKPFWAHAPWTDAFVDILGASMPVPRFRTRAKMLWDDENLYIGAMLEDPHVWGTLTMRDAVIFQDNDFEVFIDPDGDNHLYAELEINALNTVWDLLLVKPYRDGGPAINGWDIKGLLTATRVFGTLNDPSDVDEGWSVEIAIPFAALKEISSAASPPTVGDQWRINFSRVQWEHEVREGKYRKVEGKPEDNWVWSPQPAVDMHRPEAWGILQFADNAKEPAIPYDGWEERVALMDVYYAQRDFFQNHQRFASSGEIGTDNKIVLTEGGWQATFREWSIDESSRIRKR